MEKAAIAVHRQQAVSSILLLIVGDKFKCLNYKLDFKQMHFTAQDLGSRFRPAQSLMVILHILVEFVCRLTKRLKQLIEHNT